MKVPVYNRQPVQSQNLPNVRFAQAPAQAFNAGGPVADAAQKLQQTSLRVASQEIDRADAIKANDLFDKRRRFDNEKMLEAQNRRGEDAFTLPEEMAESRKKFNGEITKDLNDRQRSKFAAKLADYDFQFDRGIQNHVSAEIERHDDSRSKSLMEAERETATLNANDPDIVKSSIGKLEKTYLDYADRKGFSPEQRDLELHGHKSQAHASVLKKLTDSGQTSAAREYLAANSESMTESDSSAINGIMKTATDKELAFSAADDWEARGLSVSGAMREARERFKGNPEARAAAESRFSTVKNMREAAKREGEERLFLNATNIIEKNKNFEDIPASTISQLSLSQRSALRSYAGNVSKGIPVSTDFATYYDLKTQAATPELQDKFLQTNILEYRNKLSDSDFKSMIDLQAGLRKDDPRAKALSRGFLSETQIVNEGLIEAGFSTKADDKNAMKFRSAVDVEVLRYQEINNKKPNTQEYKKIRDDLMEKYITDKGIFWNTTPRKFELEPNQRDAVDASEIPKLDRKKIIEALRSKNIPQTNQAIIELYRQGRGNRGS